MFFTIVSVFIVCFDLSLVITFCETSSDLKYAPMVSLIKPKGFSVSIEGSRRKPSCSFINAKEKTSPRYKREVTSEVNTTKVSNYNYGTMCMSETRNEMANKFIDIKQINNDYKEKLVLVRGRLQTSRKRGKQCFIVLRQQDHTIQCLVRLSETVSRQMVKFASSISKESVIDILGKVQTTLVEIKSCTEKWVELLVEELWVVSEAEVLPIQVVDCARSDKETVSESSSIHVSQDKRLDNRVLDLRTPANQAIFRIQSAVTQVFREALINKGFIEIHTPKIINAASEGGADVFNISYFKTSAYLAQSPQLYKQMAIAADFEKVFTVGAVFRAEESHTSRHLTEFVGIDLEMAFKYHYSEVLDTIEHSLIEVFKVLQSNYRNEISTVREQFSSEPFEFIEPPPRIKYSEGVAMLRAAGEDVESNSDLSQKQEKMLGKIIKEKLKTDFFVLYKYPISVRPFYTMADPTDSKLSNSYDIFMRGEEIMSGAQRIHNFTLLKKSAKHHGINLCKIKGYLDAFRYGCPPHAGGGIGLERTVALFLGLDNIRKTSMFPRDPDRFVFTDAQDIRQLHIFWNYRKPYNRSNPYSSTDHTNVTFNEIFTRTITVSDTEVELHVGDSIFYWLLLVTREWERITLHKLNFWIKNQSGVWKGVPVPFAETYYRDYERYRRDEL